VTTAIVYKICARAAWDDACRRGACAGSADDRRDGFIHLSAPHQLAGTAAKHFRGQADLVLVAFEATRLGPKLAWESSRDGDPFPHLYADLPTSAALWVKPLALGPDGMPILPEDL
jgi:uncharacterized protein (DUF952 family)